MVLAGSAVQLKKPVTLSKRPLRNPPRHVKTVIFKHGAVNGAANLTELPYGAA